MDDGSGGNQKVRRVGTMDVPRVSAVSEWEGVSARDRGRRRGKASRVPVARVSYCGRRRGRRAGRTCK
jgi:hypothetical protein